MGKSIVYDFAFDLGVPISIFLMLYGALESDRGSYSVVIIICLSLIVITASLYRNFPAISFLNGVPN